jgi:hypothetical protein
MTSPSTENSVKQQVATEYLLAALQAHRVMAEYTKHEFQHYPSIGTIINYHFYRDRVPWSVLNKDVRIMGGACFVLRSIAVAVGVGVGVGRRRGSLVTETAC